MKKILYILLAMMILITGKQVTAGTQQITCADISEIPQLECEALMALYSNAGGTQWFDKTNWWVTATPSNWYGVTVTSGHVTGIKLNNNNLYSGIPVQLGNLTQLISLELQDNNLFSSIPTELGNLTNLEVLRLDNNDLHQNIPVNLGYLTKLKILRLNRNTLIGDIPNSLINLVDLANPEMASDGGDGLDLGYNYFNIPAGYPDPLNSFHTFLEVKDPDWHLLQWGPFVNCASVFEITVAECDALVALYNNTNGAGWTKNTGWLTTNGIGGWYGVRVEAGHVVVLDMPFNNMIGSLPLELGNLTYLRRLALNDNLLSGNIPPGIGNMTDLVYAYLYMNELTGSIPPGMGNLTNLVDLFVGSNHLSGNIPPELGSLTSLKRLTLGGNQLTGNIPHELGGLASLELLSLGGNQLSGSIPAELGQLTNLKDLWLAGNHLSGNVPESLMNLINLYGPGEDAGRDGLSLDYNHLFVPPDYPNQENPFHMFLNMKDPDWHLHQTTVNFIFLPVVRK